jgi:two-component system NarL family response regulator
MDEKIRAIRVLVVDDHPLFRSGLAALIDHEFDMQVVGEAGSGDEAVEQYDRLRPDVTLLDLQMPQLDGLGALTAIRRAHLSARVIILTTFAGDVLAKRALNAGAQAYLLKGAIRHELFDIIRAVHSGAKRIATEVAQQLADHMGLEGLSEREVQVLQLVASGNTNRRIGRALSISEETAKGHVKSILGKLGANDRTHAVTLALSRGFIRL